MRTDRPATLLFLSLLCACATARAQDGVIATWRGGAIGALSVTWDDNEPTQFTSAVPLMNKYGIRATLFVITDEVTNWDTVRMAAADGHEIASHSVSHPRFDDIDSQTIEYELRRSREIIDSQIPAQKCVTHAYPWCQYRNAESLARLYYIAARGCGAGMALDTGQSVEDTTPGNMFNVQATHLDRQGDEATALIMNRMVDNLIARRGWLVELHHGIDSMGYMWSYSDTFELHLKYMAARKKDVYIAPFGEVARYVLERNCAAVALVAQSDTQKVYRLTDTLSDSSIFNTPLTVKIALPSAWPFGIAVQDGDTMNCRLSGDTLMFDAVPDGGDVVVTKSNVAIRISDGTAHNPPVACFGAPPRLRFSGSMFVEEAAILTPSGKTVAVFARDRRFGPSETVALGGFLKGTGVYVVRIRSPRGRWMKKLSYLR